VVNCKYRSLILCTMHTYIAAFHENCPRGDRIAVWQGKGQA